MTSIVGRRSYPIDTPTQRGILAALSDGPLHVTAIAAMLQKSVNAVQKTVHVLHGRKQIGRVARGTYRLPAPGAEVVIRHYTVAKVHAVMADLVAGKSASRTAMAHGVRQRWVEDLIGRPLRALHGDDEERYLAAVKKVRERRAKLRRGRPRVGGRAA